MSSQRNHPPTVSRRLFLKTAGSFAGTLVAAPAAAASAAAPAESAASAAIGGSLLRSGAARTDRAVRIGLLLPQSRLHPELAQSQLAGMRLALDQTLDQAGGRPLQLSALPISASPYRAAEQARQLIAAEQIDVLVGMVSGATAELLRPLLEERHIPLLINTVGANVPRANSASPYIVRNSLQQWQASWALGAWLASQGGARALLAASFYESGYDTLHSFGHGFQSAGGSVVGTYVTHRPDAGADLAALIAAIKTTQPDLVFAAYSGHMARSFVQAFAHAGLSGTIPLVAAPFAVDERRLTEHGRAALGTRSALSWSAQLETAENRAFLAAYRARTGQQADAFALLGHDAAQLIMQALDAAGGETRSERLAHALGAASFVGPRGRVAAQPGAYGVQTPLYLREVRRAGGMLHNTVIGTLATPVREVQAELTRTWVRTGWANPYLCF